MQFLWSQTIEDDTIWSNDGKLIMILDTQKYLRTTIFY